MEIADVSVHVTTKEFRDVFQTCSEEAPSRLESSRAAEMRCPLNLVQLSYKASSSSLHPLPSGGERVCPICQGEEGDLVALVGDKSDQVHVGSDNSGVGQVRVLGGRQGWWGAGPYLCTQGPLTAALNCDKDRG